MLAIGLDIGGTKIRGILWSGKRVVKACEVLTPPDQPRFEGALVSLVELLRGGRKIEGIGIGAAGVIEKSTLVLSPNIPYIKGFDFRAFYRGAGRVRVDNDARCFARAEFLEGAARGFSNMFGLTIGTGIGRAYGRKGQILRLKRFEYPEAWEKSYQALRDRGTDRELAQFLGNELSRLIKPFRPEAIVIGGGVVGREGFFWKLKAELLARGLARKIYRARLRKNSVAIGAALLITPSRR